VSTAPATVTNDTAPFSVDVKRFYLPIVIRDACPACDAAWSSDLSDDYLSHPTTNKPFDYRPLCCACGHEWCLNVKLVITLELA
jgi:hypothetical protein